MTRLPSGLPVKVRPTEPSPDKGTMNTRRIVLFWIATLTLIAGSQVIANRTPTSAPAAGAALNVEDVLSVPGMKSTDGQLAFWRERIEQTPQDFISLTYLGQTFLR